MANHNEQSSSSAPATSSSAGYLLISKSTVRWVYLMHDEDKKARSLFAGAEGGIEVYCNKVIAGSTSLELLFTSATRLFPSVVELYFCSVKIFWKLRIFVEL
ncbi:hypothetical protein C5167_034454 [Papaver somniferum]|uniref:Uncharacterized protein n=1 Tax=Papaver somniferum TaxID=3469 RepID=A0A4Y7KGW9_PAPSO|nr:hypothetical protein C5167_034454 [Papaver somniferum]